MCANSYIPQFDVWMEHKDMAKIKNDPNTFEGVLVNKMTTNPEKVRSALNITYAVCTLALTCVSPHFAASIM